MTALTATLLILCCAASWLLTIGNRQQALEGLEDTKTAAADHFQKQIYDEALTEYKACLELDPDDTECMARVAEIYHLTGQDSNCIAWCERTLRKEPGVPSLCLMEAQSYDNQKKVSSAIAALKKADSAKGDTEELERYLLELKGRYDLTYFTFLAIYPWFALPDGTICATVAENDKLCIYNAAGREQISGAFSYLGQCSDDELRFPAREGDAWFYVDEKGERRIVPEGHYSFLGPFFGGLAVAKRDGVAGYLDQTLKELRFEFQDACPLKDGMALAKKDDAWFMLDTSLQETAVCEFTDVKKDAYGNAQKYGIIVGKLPGKTAGWALYGSDGSRSNEFVAEDIRMPEAKDAPLAFCRDGKWGFVTTDGTVLIEPVYEDAKSFSKGLGAVRQDGKWGYVDRAGNMIIAPTFEEAGPFSGIGSAFVKNHAGYSLLTLLRYQT